MRWSLNKWKELQRDELYDILKLRVNVFVVEQNCPYPELDDLDQESLHLCGYLEDQLIAYLRIIPAGKHFNDVGIGRVVVTEAQRGKGFASQMMEEAMKEIENLYGEVPVVMGAQTYLVEYYRSFGFETQGEEYLEDGIPHIIMKYDPNE